MKETKQRRQREVTIARRDGGAGGGGRRRSRSEENWALGNFAGQGGRGDFPVVTKQRTNDRTHLPPSGVDLLNLAVALNFHPAPPYSARRLLLFIHIIIVFVELPIYISICTSISMHSFFFLRTRWFPCQLYHLKLTQP